MFISMRFQVPQYIDIEDKIIGPLTIKQFIYYVIAVMLLVPVFALADTALFVTVTIPVAGIAALFAHGRFHGQPFVAVAGHAISFYVTGRFYVWRRGTITQPMRIAGAEYQVLPLALERIAAVPALTARAQALETEGKLITEDVADVIVGEEEQPKKELPDQPPAPDGDTKPQKDAARQR